MSKLKKLKTPSFYGAPVILGPEFGMSNYDNVWEHLMAVDINYLKDLAEYSEKAKKAYEIRTSKLGKYLEGMTD
jgi:hypothetical protein